MMCRKWPLAAVVLGSLGALPAFSQNPAQEPLAWPEVTRDCKPWAINWWLGSAVDKENLAKELERYRASGLGGIHIVPIYGAKGAEARYIDYLSPKWLEMLKFAVEEAERKDMGVDMTTGTGWCFGGPAISQETAIESLSTAVIEPPADGSLKNSLKGLTPVALVARAPDGRTVSVLDRLRGDGTLDWKPEGTGWKLGLVAKKCAGTRVKRASPGSEGFMLNPLYAQAMRDYLAPFTKAFDAPGTAKPHAMYHDSFEYYGAGWSPDFLTEFEARRGYRLQDQAALFAGLGDSQQVARVKSDYRETVSDLIIDSVFPLWKNWCRERGILTRIQAHGAPANLLDFYALADIPETEMFGRGDRDPLRSGFGPRFQDGDREPLVSKLASSAAHLTGRRLVSSETCTWMANHFCETLEETKCFVDLMLVSGINHVYYHGTCYSPDDAAWPGWLFYAATEMNPRNPIWRDTPTLNAYIARCQSVLQSGSPDNDILLYWPLHDSWNNPEGLLEWHTVHYREWLLDRPVGRAARTLWNAGYSFDFVSDRLLAGVRAEGGRLVSAEAKYAAVVVPPADVLPVETMRKLVALAREGATVIFADKLPQDVPGFGKLEERRAAFRPLLAELRFTEGQGLREARVGTGRALCGELRKTLEAAAVARETLADNEGTLFIRRRHAAGRHYFIANQSTNTLDRDVTLAVPAQAAAVMDPMTGACEPAAIRPAAGGTSLRLRLEPGHSVLLKTFDARALAETGSPVLFQKPGPVEGEIAGPWQVSFLEGGPVLPKPFTQERAGSWAHRGDPDAERFGGTAVYRTTFDLPAGQAAGAPLFLDLGRVCHSARVSLNGRVLGCLIMAPYRMPVPSGILLATGNRLEVEVTNLGANRIRDLDLRKVEWRIFNDINFIGIGGKKFDASTWPVMESGLLGPVRLLRTGAK